ncbi:SHOCT domain-containing protein [Streptomyces griseoruber]
MTNKIDQLKQLGDLKSQGILSDAEFEEQKRRLLA